MVVSVLTTAALVLVVVIGLGLVPLRSRVLAVCTSTAVFRSESQYRCCSCCWCCKCLRLLLRFLLYAAAWYTAAPVVSSASTL